jgi:hypothetical protein
MYARAVSVAAVSLKKKEIADILTRDAPSDWGGWTGTQEEG